MLIMRIIAFLPLGGNLTLICVLFLSISGRILFFFYFLWILNIISYICSGPAEDYDAILGESYGGGVGPFETYKNLSVKSLGGEKYEVSFIGDKVIVPPRQKTIVLKLSEENGMTKISEILSTN